MFTLDPGYSVNRFSTCHSWQIVMSLNSVIRSTQSRPQYGLDHWIHPKYTRMQYGASSSVKERFHAMTRSWASALTICLTVGFTIGTEHGFYLCGLHTSYTNNYTCCKVIRFLLLLYWVCCWYRISSTPSVTMLADSNIAVTCTSHCCRKEYGESISVLYVCGNTCV